MSLVVINNHELYLEKREVQQAYLSRVALNFQGTSNIVVPRNADEFADKVYRYMPYSNLKRKLPANRKNNLIILGGIDEYFDKEETDIGYYRLHDLFVSHKGGIIVGDKPSYDSVAYKPGLSVTKDIQYIVDITRYNTKFSENINMKSTVDYLGRGDSYPRAIIYGFALDYPKISMGGLTLLGGLTDYENFWHDVGWFRTRNRERQRKVMRRLAYNTFPGAARITITETADRIMTEEDIPHVHIPGRPGKAKTFTERQQYGSLIYEKMLEFYDKGL